MDNFEKYITENAKLLDNVYLPSDDEKYIIPTRQEHGLIEESFVHFLTQPLSLTIKYCLFVLEWHFHRNLGMPSRITIKKNRNILLSSSNYIKFKNI